MSVVALKMFLNLGTLGFVLALAYINMRQTERLLRDSREKRKRQELASASTAYPTAIAAE